MANDAVSSRFRGLGPRNSSSAAYEASRIASAFGGVLFTLTGYNSKATAQFIQLHDSATLPADTAVPKVTFTVAGTSNFSLSYLPFGKEFANGIVACNSSTGPTKTIGSADCWFEVTFVSTN